MSLPKSDCHDSQEVAEKQERVPGRPRNVVRPTDGQPLRPVPPEEIACEAMREHVLGYTGGIYHGRKVVFIRLPKGLFGRTDRTVHQYRTLHNGFINHGELSSNLNAAWVIQDLMADRMTFKRLEIIDAAAITMGGAGFLKTCIFQFNILITHEIHPTKCRSGYSYIVNRWGEDGRMSIRPRLATETVEFNLERKNRFRNFDSFQPVIPYRTIRRSKNT